jgi:hypothetical protein
MSGRSARPVKQRLKRGPPPAPSQRVRCLAGICRQLLDEWHGRQRASANRLLNVLIRAVMGTFMRQQGVARMSELDAAGEDALLLVFHQFDAVAITNRATLDPSCAPDAQTRRTDPRKQQ